MMDWNKGDTVELNMNYVARGHDARRVPFSRGHQFVFKTINPGSPPLAVVTDQDGRTYQIDVKALDRVWLRRPAAAY
jgi:hypothetical protein